MKATQENLKSAISDYCKMEHHLMNWDAAKVYQNGKQRIGGLKRGLKSGSGPQRLSTVMKEPTNFPIPGTQCCRAAPGCSINHQTTEGALPPPPAAPWGTQPSHHLRWDG